MDAPTTSTRPVSIGPHAPDGELALPPRATALVVFAHGSGSSRHSPRNQQVARTLQQQGLATLLFDLLAPDEAPDRRLTFDIELLGQRLVEALDWVDRTPALAQLPIGLFGASTGAAAALVAAAARPQRVYAVVSRGGRPDLAGAALPHVQAPTRLIVGAMDTEVLELNRRARRSLGGRAELCVVAGATHLFEEPGTLAEAAQLAADWFCACRPRAPMRRPARPAG